MSRMSYSTKVLNIGYIRWTALRIQSCLRLSNTSVHFNRMYHSLHHRHCITNKHEPASNTLLTRYSYSVNASDGEIIYFAPRTIIDYSKFFFRDAVLFSGGSLVTALVLGMLHHTTLAATLAVIPCLCTGIGQYWCAAFVLSICYNSNTDQLTVYAPGQYNKAIRYMLRLGEIKSFSVTMVGPLIYVQVLGVKGQRLQMLLHPSVFNSPLMKKTFLSDEKKQNTLISQQRVRLRYLTGKLNMYSLFANATSDAHFVQALPQDVVESVKSWFTGKSQKTKDELDAIEKLIKLMQSK